jgi:hypothetical protein
MSRWPRFAALLLVPFVALVGGCFDEDTGDDTTGPGDTTPAVNLAGNWILASTSTSTSAARASALVPELVLDEATITQVGGTIGVALDPLDTEDDPFVFPATLSGLVMSFDFTQTDTSEGWTGHVVGSLTAATDGNFVSGTASGTYTDSSGTESDASTIEGYRQGLTPAFDLSGSWTFNETVVQEDTFRRMSDTTFSWSYPATIVQSGATVTIQIPALNDTLTAEMSGPFIWDHEEMTGRRSYAYREIATLALFATSANMITGARGWILDDVGYYQIYEHATVSATKN